MNCKIIFLSLLYSADSYIETEESTCTNDHIFHINNKNSNWTLAPCACLCSGNVPLGFRASEGTPVEFVEYLEFCSLER